jgi:hypothetical protein
VAKEPVVPFVTVLPVVAVVLAEVPAAVELDAEAVRALATLFDVVVANAVAMLEVALLAS